MYVNLYEPVSLIQLVLDLKQHKVIINILSVLNVKQTKHGFDLIFSELPTEECLHSDPDTTAPHQGRSVETSARPFIKFYRHAEPTKGR